MAIKHCYIDEETERLLTAAEHLQIARQQMRLALRSQNPDMIRHAAITLSERKQALRRACAFVRCHAA